MVICLLSLCVCRLFLFFFFFKQKTAYEMRISDWSSDVCSSDLGYVARVENAGRRVSGRPATAIPIVIVGDQPASAAMSDTGAGRVPVELAEIAAEIGRASCRERVCQYV